MFLTFQIVLLYLFILIYSPGKQNKRQTKESRFKRAVTPLLTMLLSASEEGNILSFRSRSWTVQHTWWSVRATGAERCRFPQHLKHKTQTVSAAFKGRRLIWRLFTELCLVFPPNNRLISLCLSIRPWMDGFGGGGQVLSQWHMKGRHTSGVSPCWVTATGPTNNVFPSCVCWLSLHLHMCGGPCCPPLPNCGRGARLCPVCPWW